MSSPDSLTDIYIITNLLNGDAYVGQAVQYKRGGKKHGTRSRFHDHVSEALNRGTTGCRHLNAAIRKYGADMFEPRTQRVVASAEADYWETWYIAEYNTFEGPGYNLTAGAKCAGQLLHGAYGQVITAEMRLKMSAAGKTYDSSLPMYISERHHLNGDTGYVVYSPELNTSRSFSSGSLSMNQKLQLAMAWQKAAKEGIATPARTDPKTLPPYIQYTSKKQGRAGLQVIQKMSRKGNTPLVTFYKAFRDGTFEDQLAAAKACLEEQIQQGVITPKMGRRAQLEAGV